MSKTKQQKIEETTKLLKEVKLLDEEIEELVIERMRIKRLLRSIEKKNHP